MELSKVQIDTAQVLVDITNEMLDDINGGRVGDAAVKLDYIKNVAANLSASYRLAIISDLQERSFDTEEFDELREEYEETQEQSSLGQYL